MKPRVCGIYQIKSMALPTQLYIGSSNDIYRRWDEHRKMLRKNNHHSIKLQIHRNTYGTYDLVCSLLCCCDEDSLMPLEQFFIDTLEPYFNIRKDAEWHPRKTEKRIITEEEHQRRSLSQMGHGCSEETRRKMGEGIKKFWEDHPNKRKALSEKLLGENAPHYGKTPSEETRRKISEGLVLYYADKKKPKKKKKWELIAEKHKELWCTK